MNITSKDKINIEDSFKVEAGPGAGKTAFLVNHIKNILQNSKRLSCTRKIACITYTNTAVETILKRLGKEVADKVEVSTIHSFLYKNIVKPYCSFLPVNYELCYSKVNGHDDFYVNREYTKEWLLDKYFNSLKHPTNRNQILGLPDLNKVLKNWLLSMKCVYKNHKISFECDNTKAYAYDKDNKRVGINKQNLTVLSSKLLDYKKIYWRKGVLDHNDILFFSYILITEQPFILTILRAKFPYMLIDEYQDTSPIQSFIVDEIRKAETIIGVIGDKAQSIYQFQGAEPALFDVFTVDKTNMYTICQNHRSTNQIRCFLNNIRTDIQQAPCVNTNGANVAILVGDRQTAYEKACYACCGKAVVSLSRDNATSNAMKKNVDDTNIDRKLIDKFKDIDSNGNRRKYISSFIEAIELAVNSKYKDAIKRLEWIFRGKENPKKETLCALSKMLNDYDIFCDDNLMKFYNTLCVVLDKKLPGFKAGNIKIFYDNTQYKSLALCINITEDNSNHITIHKSKGTEFDNVMITHNKYIVNFLVSPTLDNNEEHRVLYVALSRAKKRLFLHLENLDDITEKTLKVKYTNISIVRL